MYVKSKILSKIKLFQIDNACASVTNSMSASLYTLQIAKYDINTALQIKPFQLQRLDLGPINQHFKALIHCTDSCFLL